MADVACPGICNYRYREAQAAHRQALADYDPLDANQSRPEPPDIRPVLGTPWCARCHTYLRRELAELDELAAILTHAADGQRGQRPGAKMPRGKNHGGPSPSPTADLLEELAGDLRGWEHAVRGGAPLTRRGHLATETTAMIAWLSAQFDKAIIMTGHVQDPAGHDVPFAVAFGEGIQTWHRKLVRLTKAGTGTHHKPCRCPRCDLLTLFWTEGDDHVECKNCGRLLGLDEYDELARAQDAEHAAGPPGTTANPAA